jgi:hemerythrin-like domain-containing protein
MSPLDRVAITQVQSNHQSLLVLCELLEAIADSLPANIDRQQCLVLARSLAPMMHRTQAYEEQVLFPALLLWKELTPDITPTIERLRLEHQVDASYAEDVEEMLRTYGMQRPALSPDAAGFMLRGFFDALRRHIAFEQQMLLPLLAVPPVRAN